MSILIELWHFLASRKKYWLIPVLVMMFVIGGLLIFAQSSVIAPFIYSLF